MDRSRNPRRATAHAGGLAIWMGDTHLVRHDWLVGAAVFAVGFAATGLTVRLLRRAGLVS